jgi:hypothetical protein
MIGPGRTIAKAKAGLQHLAAVEAKRKAQHALDLLRNKYCAALARNDQAETRKLDREYREALLPAFERAAAAEREARAELETAR